MRVGIVGCGLIGQKRAKALGPKHQLVAVADLNVGRAQSLAAQHAGCEAYADWRQVVDHPGVELVIVATTNDMLTPVSLAAVAQGKHVLVEKPAARNAAEIEPLVELTSKNRALVKVGFNHRFHPAFIKAWEIWQTGELGELMYIRGRYGHGGRLGYDKEWRADPQVAGGGELLDQGVHLIDLSRWFAGEFSRVEGHLATYYWDMPVEDNAFLTLKTATGQVSFCHVSCAVWKNIFSFEIVGRYGQLQWDGLGGSYGVERLTYYKMLPEMGPPPTFAWEWPGEDKSWQREFDYFVQCIERGQPPEGNLNDAWQALKIIGTLYQKSSYPKQP